MIDGRSAPRDRGAKTALARMRLARGMTQQQLADAVGSQQKEVTRWETGKQTPRPAKLLQIAKALKCKIEDLIDEPSPG